MKERALKTYIGALISLVCSSLVCWFIFKTGERIFDKSNPTVIQITENDIENIKMDLVKGDSLPAITFYHSSEYYTVPADQHSSLVTMEAEIRESYIDYSNYQLHYQSRKYPLKPCHQLINKKPYQKLFDENSFGDSDRIQYGSCIEIPENEEFNLNGNRFSTRMSYLEIMVYPCSLSNASLCAPISLLS